VPEERVQRALARGGLGSRRACEELIKEGRVAINGRPAELGDKVDPSADVITVDGDRVAADPEMRYFLLNKPAGVITTMEDPQGRTDITGFLPEGPRVFPVGRLDQDSEGLLILTNDGELANRLTHPRYGVEKEYLAEVDGTPAPKLLSRLRSGVELGDGPAKVLDVRVASQSGERAALRVVMGEGRKREVRRLLDAVGLPVVRLVRLRQGPLRLQGVGPGETRALTPEEVRQLYLAAGL
jgi:23S rRNA pseudouridine2605 synthase